MHKIKVRNGTWEIYLKFGGEGNCFYEIAEAIGREDDDDDGAPALERYSEIGLSRVGCHSPL